MTAPSPRVSSPAEFPAPDADNLRQSRPRLRYSGEMDEPLLEVLLAGPLYRFRDWPPMDVPRYGAGVYTVWQEDRLVYVGMSGRSITASTPPRRSPLGLFTRLASHASGRRSGDQFCVYVADRLVLPTLTREQIGGISSGAVSLDGLVKSFIHDRLTYRFVTVPDGTTAFRVERLVQAGALGAPPLLNPAARG